LNRWVADDDVLPNRVAARTREHDDAVRVTNRGIGLDQVIGGCPLKADPEVGRRSGRVAVAARLVPPERVARALDSYAAACGRGGAVPHRHIAFHANRR
jgi:hypothetical protein